MRSTPAIDVPPNFITMRAMGVCATTLEETGSPVTERAA
jgi:hypothetical protein